MDLHSSHYFLFLVFLFLTDESQSDLANMPKTATRKEVENERMYCSINNIQWKKFSNKSVDNFVEFRFKTEISSNIVVTTLCSFYSLVCWMIKKYIKWERKCLGFNSNLEKHRMWLIENIFLLVAKHGFDIQTILAILKVPGAAFDQPFMKIIRKATSAGIITADTPDLLRCK